MLNFSHTYLYLKDLIRTYFCGIYVVLWDFLVVKITKFSIPKNLDLAFCRSTGRSTAAEVGRPVQSIDMHKRARQLELVGRSTRQSTVQRVLLSGNGPGRPAGRRAESSALCIQFRSTGRSTGQRAVAL